MHCHVTFKLLLWRFLCYFIYICCSARSLLIVANVWKLIYKRLWCEKGGDQSENQYHRHHHHSFSGWWRCCQGTSICKTNQRKNLWFLWCFDLINLACSMIVLVFTRLVSAPTHPLASICSHLQPAFMEPEQSLSKLLSPPLPVTVMTIFPLKMAMTGLGHS